VTDRALEPILSGLTAGDVDRLSVHATFPELQVWERAQGSLIRGAQAALRDARRGGDPGPMFLAPVGGMSELPAALVRALGDGVRPGAVVTSAGRSAVVLEGGTEELTDAVIVAAGAAAAAGVLRKAAPDAASGLGELVAASVATVLLVYADGTASALPDGAGFVVPRGRAPMTSCVWLSSKWPREAYRSRAVLRCTVGGDGLDDVVHAPDGEIVDACERHLRALLPLPDHAEAARVVRWNEAMPQYRPGHVGAVAAIREGLPAGIFVAGQAYDGVGVTDGARSGLAAAEAAAGFLGINDAPSIERETEP
jgi:oxygen-dependent protoporphyrinogen oxidase